jgi:hypothetical protein
VDAGVSRCPRGERSVGAASSVGAGRTRGSFLAGEVDGGARTQRLAEALQIGIEIETGHGQFSLDGVR